MSGGLSLLLISCLNEGEFPEADSASSQTSTSNIDSPSTQHHPRDVVGYLEDIKPLLLNFGCESCHGAGTAIDLTTYEGVKESQAVEAVWSQRMPPSAPLPANLIQVFSLWQELGYPYSREDVKIPEPSAQEEQQSGGIALYAANCSLCHNSLAESTKKGRNEEAITQAIALVPQMAALTHLSAEDIRLIAEALADDDALKNDPLLTGAELYEQSCASCHGSLEFSQKKGATSESIKIAISQVTGMQFLTSLTDEQIQSIAKALAVEETTKKDDPMTPLIPLTMMGESFVVSYYESIFLNAPTNQNVTEIRRILDEEVGNHHDLYKGYCAPHDKNCPSRGLEAQGVSSAMRAARGARICSRLIAITGAVENTLHSVGLDPSVAPTQAGALKVFSLFSDDLPNEATLLALSELMAQSQSLNLSVQNQWRAILFPFCDSAMVGLL